MIQIRIGIPKETITLKIDWTQPIEKIETYMESIIKPDVLINNVTAEFILCVNNMMYRHKHNLEGHKIDPSTVTLIIGVDEIVPSESGLFPDNKVADLCDHLVDNTFRELCFQRMDNDAKTALEENKE